MEQTKPAVESGGHRQIEISNWRSYSKNSLQGFLDATMPSGVIYRGLMLHARDGSRWLNFPTKEYKDARGERQFATLIDFATREDKACFQRDVLEAVDRYFEMHVEPEEQPL